MVIRVANPLASLLDIQQALASVGNGDSWFSGSTSNRSGFPPINIFEDGESYVMIAEIPGVKRDDINVEIHQNRVRFSGEKSIDYGDKASMHRNERQRGKFDRTFTTPFEIDADKARAEYRDGILALFLPRAEQDKPRSIKIA